MRTRVKFIAICLLALLALTGVTSAQVANQIGPPGPSSGSLPSLSLSIGGNGGAESLSSSLEIVLVLTLLTLAPAMLLTMTSFARIVVVLSFLKRATTIQEMPPKQVTIGIAIFLTIFVMAPTFSGIQDKALTPYTNGEIDILTAAENAGAELSVFLLGQTREEDLELIYEIAKSPAPATPAEVPFHYLVPAFVLSEMKTAFQMGFLLFLPFLVIDIVIASILISMGMFTLPPVIISTPFKILLFLLVDGWGLVIKSLVQSFVVT